MPPWMIGCSMPNSSVIAVFTKDSCALLRVRPWMISRCLSLPLLAKGADFELERPGALRLLIELPVGFRDRGGRHQKVGVVQRVRPERLQPPLTHPFGVDAGINDEVGDMDILRPELARGRLRHGAQAEFGAGKGRVTDAAAQRRGCAGEEDVGLAA